MTLGTCLLLCVTILLGFAGMTVYLVTALSKIMAGIARHNKHMDDIKVEIRKSNLFFSLIAGDIRGAANFYKRTEDEKRVQ